VTPARRTAAYYLTLFTPPSAFVVVGGPWFAAQGLTESQIGILTAAPIFAMLLLSILVGRIADRARDWRQVIVTCAGLSALGALALIWADGFWGILLAWSLTMMAHMLAVPVLDAAALRMSQRTGADFGALRSAGTVGFLIPLVASGYLALWYGPAAFLPLYIGLAAVRAAVALILPPFRAPDGSQTPGASRLAEVLRPWFLLPLAGFAAIHATHMVLGSFQSLIWVDQGIPLSTIGWLAALGALSEAAVFYFFVRVSHLLKARVWILIAAGLALIRWGLMALEPPVWALALLQASHGVTYGMGFLATTLFIANWTSDRIAAEAQGFFVTLQQGMTVISLVVFGALLGWSAPGAWLFLALTAAAGAGAVALSLARAPPQVRASPPPTPKD
jgi:MFS transporter, PPP family, 3-phenylpropionic acid transporter